MSGMTDQEFAAFVLAGGSIEVLAPQKVSRKVRISNIRSGKYRVFNTKLTPKRDLLAQSKISNLWK
jgi:hypothetical protein